MTHCYEICRKRYQLREQISELLNSDINDKHINYFDGLSTEVLHEIMCRVFKQQAKAK